VIAAIGKIGKSRFEIERRVVFRVTTVFVCVMSTFWAYHPPLAASQPFQQESSGPGQASAAQNALRNWHVTEGRVKAKLPATEMTLAQANKIPIDLHGFPVIQILALWRPSEPGVAEEWQELPLQHESDDRAYVNFVPTRLGKLELRILVAFADGGVDQDKLEVNVGRLPDQPPTRFFLATRTGLTTRAGTLRVDLTGLNKEILIPVAFYKGVASPIRLIPAPGQIQSQLSYTIIPRKNQPEPIVLDPQTGVVRGTRPGQALVKATFGNQSAYACIDVRQDTDGINHFGNCSDFLPTDLKEPIDEPLYGEPPVAPPAN
jgi:hypothetical protein